MALFVGFGCRLDVKKININPQFFFPPLYFFHQLKHHLFPPDLLETSPRRASAGEKAPLQPFPQLLRRFASGSPTSPRPISPELTLKLVSLHQKRGVFAFSPCVPASPLPNDFKSTRGAAALPEPGARAGQSPVGVFADMCGWRRWEVLQMPKFHSLKKTTTNNQTPNATRKCFLT